MAGTDMITVNVPDHAAVRLPKSLTLQEVRDTLAAQGYPSLASAQAEYSADGNTLTFKRPTGGVKGL